jgi:hypothetical protein
MMSAWSTFRSWLAPRMWSFRSCHCASHERLPTYTRVPGMPRAPRLPNPAPACREQHRSRRRWQQTRGKRTCIAYPAIARPSPRRPFSPRHPRSPRRRRPHTRCQEACQQPANRSTRHPSSRPAQRQRAILFTDYHSRPRFAVRVCARRTRSGPAGRDPVCAQYPSPCTLTRRALPPVLRPSCLPAALFRPPLHRAASARARNPILRYFMHFEHKKIFGQFLP